MSSNQRSFPLKYVTGIADKILNRISPYCHIAHKAGSVRRGAVMVGDIEIVCVPKKIKVGTMNLFGEDTRKEISNPDFTDIIKNSGKTISGNTNGRMMKLELPEKINMDLFMPIPHDFWRVFAIRTGSSEYSHKIIAGGWVKNGWVGTTEGLRLRTECTGTQYKSGKDLYGNDIIKTKWVCDNNKPTLPPVWESEKEFFDWIGVQYLHPAMRTV